MYRIRQDQIRPSQTRPNQTGSGIRQAAYRTGTGHDMRTGQKPDRPSDDRPQPLALHSTRPAGRPPQIFPPNLTAHYSAMRVVQVPSLALTLFDVPACCCRAQARHIVEPAARQLGGLDTGVRQVQVIRDASLTVPACWQAGWMLVRVRHRPHAAGFDCARLFAGALSTGSIAVHTTRRWYAVAGCRAFRPVKPSGHQARL